MESLLEGQLIPFHRHGFLRKPERTKSPYDVIHKISPGMYDYLMAGDDFLLHNFKTLYYNAPELVAGSMAGSGLSESIAEEN
jgi:hypothetical protein